jgi:uncharacterized protein YecE (DUF72 family)
VEINSSFYRPHRASTYARWAACVPHHFRFAVKIPRAITHELCLLRCDDVLARFLSEVTGLGGKLGPLLVQLPPRLAFDHGSAREFFRLLREKFAGDAVCEPRHASWFAMPADDMLKQHRIARVAADPAPAPEAARPGGWSGLAYYRLHGSPRMYYSEYGDAYLAAVARELTGMAGAKRWCIFDNTARGAAVINALRMRELLDPSASGDSCRL